MLPAIPPPPTEAEASEQAAGLLRHMGIDSEKGLYVIGCYDRRITIHSQQIRATNLIYALSVTGVLQPGAKVAVIGGGVGGMTAALAAASLQSSVTIFERQSELLHLLRGCHTRHLHPNVYDWPSEGALNPNTELPFLNWTANTADQVALQLLDQWESAATRLRVVERTSTKVMERGLSGSQRRVTILAPRYEDELFDIVIMAVGFGVEKTIPLFHYVHIGETILYTSLN